MLNRLRDWLCPDLGIDLGTVNTRIAVRGLGVVLDEPTILALERKTRRVLGRGAAIGKLARQMVGRTPDSMLAVSPIRHGVISDFELCEVMLKYFIQKASKQGGGFRPRCIVSVPSELSSVEKRAVYNSIERAGAGRIFLIDHARAASIGAGLPISEPLASMICDIGGGTTECAILSLGEAVASKSVRIAGNDMDDAIIDYLRQHYSLRIGRPTAEQLKIEIGSAAALDTELSSEVRGLDSISGIPRKAILTSEEVREALGECLWKIVNCIKAAIEQCDPELIGDLADTGLTLTGGTSQLRNLDLFLREHLGIPVRIDPDPMSTVARGTAICLEHMRNWSQRFQTEGAGF